MHRINPTRRRPHVLIPEHSLGKTPSASHRDYAYAETYVGRLARVKAKLKPRRGRRQGSEVWVTHSRKGTYRQLFFFEDPHSFRESSIHGRWKFQEKLEDKKGELKFHNVEKKRERLLNSHIYQSGYS